MSFAGVENDVIRRVRLVLLVGLVHLLAGCGCGDCTDEDGDGFTTCEGDCNDANSTMYPQALEICNGLDDDCSGIADQNFDADGDGHLETTSCPGVVGADDCDDGNPLRHPGLEELCDEVDHNCDGDSYAGATDLSDYCPDGDFDGYPAEGSLPVSNCGGAGWVDCSSLPDCDDALAAIFPGATPSCDDGTDADCDGNNDNDVDEDGFADDSCGGSDCNDAEDSAYPGATELCDGLDNDCNGSIDDDIAFDSDADGQLSAALCPGVAGADDCDDDEITTYTGAPELCDGVDNNCNGQIDESSTPSDWYPDIDGDGFGDPTQTPTSSCQDLSTQGYSNQVGATDCDDGNNLINVLATEVCDGIDQDCLLGIDNGFDADGDGFFDALDAGCLVTYGALADCDDTLVIGLPTNPAAAEICDGIDNDCDTIIPADETDLDGDSHVECGPDWFGATGLLPEDCEPLEFTAHPLGTEVCDGLDNDCNGTVDDGFDDNDGDGVAFCPGGATATDCDDNDPSNFPGNLEVCDGQDNDCDATTNELTSDGDGDGDSPCDGDCNDNDASLNTDDIDGDTYSTCTGDCDDTTPLVNPGEPEYCDLVDNDCDLDADPANALPDGDGDGFVGTECIDPATSLPGTDCDDSDPAVFPVAEYTSGMQRQCRPAVYPGFRHQWNQFESSQPNYFFDTVSGTHYLYFRGNRNKPARAIGVVSTTDADWSDGVDWSVPAAAPLLSNDPSGWDVTNLSSPSVLHVASLAGSPPVRPYFMMYHSETAGIGLTTSLGAQGPFERLGPDGTAIAGPVLSPGASGTLDDFKAQAPTVLLDGSGQLFMWYGARNSSNDYNILYATSANGLAWNKYDTTAPGSPDPLLGLGTTGEWDDSKVQFPVVRDNSDPLNLTQAYEVWYAGRSSINQGGVARGDNSIAWDRHPLNPCLPAYSTPSRLDGKDVVKFDRRFEPDSDPVAAAAGAGIYHLFYHSKTASTGDIYGAPAGNAFNDVHYVAYAINNAPQLAFTSPSSGGQVTSPFDVSGTITDNAPDGVLLTLFIDGVEQTDVATITPADASNFGVQTTAFTFSQLSPTLTSGTHVIKVAVSDEGGSERTASLFVNVP